MRPLHPKVIDRNRDAFQNKFLEPIKQTIDQKDLSRSKIAIVMRIDSAIAGEILRGDCEKVSTDRLFTIARRMGLKTKLKIK